MLNSDGNAGTVKNARTTRDSQLQRSQSKLGSAAAMFSVAGLAVLV